VHSSAESPTLELFSAVSGSPFDTVGAEIGSPHAVTAAAGGTTNPVDVVTVAGGPTLTAGTSYFLAGVPGTGNFLSWNQQTSPSLVSLLAKDTTGTGTYVSVALAGFALVSIGLFRKRIKVFGDKLGKQPEHPDGFGIIQAGGPRIDCA
jgi:hypothetical protein